MRERPILFSAPMVRALLDGTKTQTRRALRPQPPQDAPMTHVGKYAPALVDRHGEMYPGPDVFGVEFDDGSDGRWCLMCPYGAPGDRLWVRETLRNTPTPKGWSYDADGEPVVLRRGDRAAAVSWAHHKVRDVCVSIHMPRWASRITLEITEVRVQRLHEISEEDAIAEGCERIDTDIRGGAVTQEFDHDNPIMTYRRLWNSRNSVDVWNTDPWVWVATFRTVG